jgi:peptidoglycan/LPS O-acetylase OafA/YrhL
MKNMNRLLEIDALRGLAALGIVLFHYASSHQWPSYHPYHYFDYLEECVQVFFIISGFVILISIERLNRTLDFVVNRVARLYPIYLISVITTILITHIIRIAQPRTESIYDLITNFLIFHGLMEAKSVNIVYWTLTLEISFYAIMLLIFKLKLVKRIDILCGCWIFFILLDTIRAHTSGSSANLMLITPEQTNYWELLYSHQVSLATFSIQPSQILVFLKNWVKTNFFLLQGRAALFIAGIMLYQGKKLGFSLYRIAIILLCIVTKAFDYSSATPWYSFLFFAFFVVVIYLIISDKLKILSVNPLIFLGTISYSLYLTHLQVNWVTGALFTNQLPIEIYIILKVFAAVMVASLLTFNVELPAMQLIKAQYKKKLS